MTDGARRARAGPGDLVRLALGLGGGWLRGRRDTGAAVADWMRATMAKDGATDLTAAIGSTRLEVIGNAAHSDRVLAGSPVDGCPVGRLKRTAMTFLAPRALTITDGAAWPTLRAFNEAVRGTGDAHPFTQAFLGRVRAAFDRPVSDIDDVRDAMGRAMTGIVLGDAPGAAGAADDVTTLFGVVQSPLKRKLLGFRYKARRDRFHSLLERCLEDQADDAPTLLARARRAAADMDRATLLDQVPHWMFTFTGSGTDLLTRTLAMVTARPAVQQRVLDEIAAAGPLDQAVTYTRLPLLDACLLETGRLFPPVTRTFHHRPASGAVPEAELVHWFPLLQRDSRLGSDVHHFVPDRWLATERDAAAAASDLFLRGPRSCPGANLILFVCRAALARMLGELGVRGGSRRLAQDPLPVSFPAREARFTTQEARS